MKNIKKLLLTVALVVGTTFLAPHTVSADTVTKTFDIDKTSANTIIANINTYGKNGVMFRKDKTIYKIKLTTKAKSLKDGQNKMKKFAKKAMSAKSNTYGLSYGIKPDDYNDDSYDSKKKVYSETLYMTANDIYYLNQITKKLLSRTEFEFLYPEKWIGDDGTPECGGGFYATKVKEVFPTTQDFKEASDSVKFQFIAEGMNYWVGNIAGAKKLKDFKWSYLYNKQSFGACHHLALMYGEIVRAIAYDWDYKYECNMNYGKSGHAVALMKVKRDDGTYDYFTGNDGNLGVFYALDDKYKKICTKDEQGYLSVWMELRPKTFLVDAIEKEARAYGRKGFKTWGPITELADLAFYTDSKYSSDVSGI